jgi:hypothetical protein
MITFEYILIAGINDSPDQAKPLAQLAQRLNAKVNLIPYNRVEGLPWERPSDERQRAFLNALTKLKITATLRVEKGHDIDAACGQLRLKTERELAGTHPLRNLKAGLPTRLLMVGLDFEKVEGLFPAERRGGLGVVLPVRDGQGGAGGLSAKDPPMIGDADRILGSGLEE